MSSSLVPEPDLSASSASTSIELLPAETHFGTVTSFIPLTTAWAAPSGCETLFRRNYLGYLMLFDPINPRDLIYETKTKQMACCPPAMTAWQYQQPLQRLSGNFYTTMQTRPSAGVVNQAETNGSLTTVSRHLPIPTRLSIGPIVCPKDWRTVASSTRDSSSVLAKCCPSGFYLADRFPGQVIPGRLGGDCLSVASSGTIITYSETVPGVLASWRTTTTALTSSFAVGADFIQGWNIKYPTVATPTPSDTICSSSSPAQPTPLGNSYHSTTLVTISASLFSATFSATLTNSFVTATSVTSLSASFTATPNANSESSIDDKIGVGVGVSVGSMCALAVLVTLYLFFRRKMGILGSRRDVRPSYSPIPETYAQRLPSEQQNLIELEADKTLSIHGEQGYRQIAELAAGQYD